ncbi:MAG TPA: hypothetical protein VFB41_02965 [Solirubrobacteraceae bacterium]|nr:hypothetical protein [Solirubrobacteraceae bacterium]
MPRSSLLAALVALIVFAGATPATAASGDVRALLERHEASARYRVAASAELDGATLVVHATVRSKASTRPLAGATVRAGGRSRVTNRSGVARLTLAETPQRLLVVTVAKRGLHGLRLIVHPRTTST